MPENTATAFAVSNVRLFVWFRVFFSARFYYPVFTILFLDFGLTLEQFAILNAAWALTIVVCEVPSGALADVFGRRQLLITTGVLMVVEILLLCVVPLGFPKLLFGVFLMNRVISGVAEAAASGADEALAFDSLKEAGHEADWGRVLAAQMRIQSAAFVVAMIIGAAVYDPALMQRAADLLGLDIRLTQQYTLRFPLYLTLAMAVLALLTALKMQESRECREGASCRVSIRQAMDLTLAAGRWILQTPFALVIMVGGLLFDSILRMTITLASQYYRMIQLPEASFGLIGAALAGVGLFMPLLAMQMAKRYSPMVNVGVMAILAAVGLAGLTLFLPVVGLAPMFVLVGVMYLTGFFASHYLNRITESHQRATVLSFRGLSFNLAYGLVGLLYSLLLAGLRSRSAAAESGLTGAGLENWVFTASIDWFPWYFLATMTLFVLFAARRLKGSRSDRTAG